MSSSHCSFNRAYNKFNGIHDLDWFQNSEMNHTIMYDLATRRLSGERVADSIIKFETSVSSSCYKLDLIH